MMDGPLQPARAGAPVAANGIHDIPSPIIKEEAMDDHEVPSFDDIDWAEQERRDDADMKMMFNNDPSTTQTNGLDLSTFGDKVIDQTNKADDAVDFEDLSDDDLASESGSLDALPDTGTSHPPGLTEDDGTSHDTDHLDDLFGGGPDGDNDYLPSSPPPEDAAATTTGTVTAPATATTATTTPEKQPAAAIPPSERFEADNEHDHDGDTNMTHEVTDEAWQNMTFEERWRLNFPQYSVSIDKWIGQTDEGMQRPLQSTEDLLREKFPHFAEHKILHFNKLLPEWPAEFQYKEPVNKDKDPPEFVPTKLELELDADCSKLFRIPDNVLSIAKQRATGHDVDDWASRFGGVVFPDAEDGFSDSDDDELVGGFSLDEISTICQDWNSLADRQPQSMINLATSQNADADDEMDDWDREFLALQPKAKRPKYEPGLPDISSYETWGIADFEEATRRSSKRVRLDISDPYLLLEDTQSARPSKRLKLEEKTKRMASGQLRRDVMRHFNISNDDAYEALKNNHKSKVRATLSSVGVEHALPALKLTFPFYRTKLEGQPWEFHRKKFDVDKVVKHNIGVRKPGKVRRKDIKGRGTQEIFKTTKDLSLNDNSTAVLFEYSEQFPTVLSNFGMGNRVINYYRRKERGDDEAIPKLEIGETHPLLPEDRSPFSIFGTVDPGDTVPTLHNEMYRAPIFKHEPRPNDFLLGYTTNASEGPRWFLRNIDHVYTVGQTFPSMEIPGPHARKVTNTSKNRLKMIAFRMMRQKETQDVSLKEITPHVFEKEDPQNRQKLKEFLDYSKETKTWHLKENEAMMDEAAIRAMIKPEDVCLVESMQVGQQLMENAGFDPKDKEENDDGVDEPLVVQLAPWRISKNFLDASAGKAMVALHGEGDPTGHGLGFSFIKTSMKGGYINAVQGPLATSADAIERERKANGGHSYNVKKQQDMYNAAIRDIWDRQKATLSDNTTHDDADVLDTANEDDRFNQRGPDATPAPVDDGRSVFSRFSAASRCGKRKLKITRKKRNSDGEVITETIIVADPLVIRNYMKQRAALTEKDRDVYSIKPTADADDNRDKAKLVEKELSRLLKNQDRRQVREKQGKGKKKNANTSTNNNSAASPDTSGDKTSGGTTRKCANCGQVGHIKTNKSKCPLLNGTITATAQGGDHGGFGSFSA
ncbi:putative transcription initiation factor TFIID subunit 1 [Rosellinia necatrix]|uniref:Putative transcription initiation factor TFIID subunit 1 n=1 Tax=Rosellinia necatrix TaxID=77044 RepID=A0A1W2TKE2_ROSNE|nr:putative transcription initiation factor TFIID subunit 1 [Rosellinia necatrix]